MLQSGNPPQQAPAEPVIVGFLCSWCAYRAADLLGMSRRPSVPNLRPIRVMCSGRVEPTLIIKAFCEGADGVLIAGCHPGECHYADGNIKALRRVVLLKKLLAQFGIEPDRLVIAWVAASEGVALADVAARMTERLRTLGPLNWSADGPLRQPRTPDSARCADGPR